jgi:hypothetical protein
MLRYLYIDATVQGSSLTEVVVIKMQSGLAVSIDMDLLTCVCSAEVGASTSRTTSGEPNMWDLY